jgi:hypothetical protein
VDFTAAQALRARGLKKFCFVLYFFLMIYYYLSIWPGTLFLSRIHHFLALSWQAAVTQGLISIVIFCSAKKQTFSHWAARGQSFH